MTLELPWALLGMQLGLEGTTRVFLAFTLLVWLLAGVFASGSLAGDPRARRFWAFFLCAFAGNLGLVLARDGASFYLFFSLMTFAAYGLIVHAGDEPARRAGRVYIAMAVLGEAFLLAGLILAASTAESLAFEHMRAASGASRHRELIVGLLFAGFGIKAGALGLHMWLPLAYRAAPTPASAVLGGAMTKAGLLGWLHFLPLGEAALPLWGVGVATAGIAAAFYAAAIGLMQDDPKTVLAYSSVSQMGLMAVAVGAALAAPGTAGVAIAAATFYALHHGLAKGALFLGVGVAPGLRSPLLFALSLLPAAALAGVPVTSGALAKYSLKHALAEPSWGEAFGTLLSFAAVGTTLLMARFAILIYLHSRHPGRYSGREFGAWLACLLASAAAAWLPFGALDLPQMPAASWSDAWPVLAGVLLAWSGARRGAPWRNWRVAPGDVLEPISTLLRHSLRWYGAFGATLEVHARRAFATVQERWQRASQRVAAASARGELRLRAAGPAAALLLLILVFLLAR